MQKLDDKTERLHHSFKMSGVQSRMFLLGQVIGLVTYLVTSVTHFQIGQVLRGKQQRILHLELQPEQVI